MNMSLHMSVYQLVPQQQETDYIMCENVTSRTWEQAANWAYEMKRRYHYGETLLFIFLYMSKSFWLSLKMVIIHGRLSWKIWHWLLSHEHFWDSVSHASDRRDMFVFQSIQMSTQAT